jgi:hypothetical protein
MAPVLSRPRSDRQFTPFRGYRSGPDGKGLVPRLGRSHALHHIVAVPFENRSFDNLLGRLYEPGAVPSFEGVIGAEAESS